MVVSQSKASENIFVFWGLEKGNKIELYSERLPNLLIYNPQIEKINHYDVIIDKSKFYQLGDYFPMPYSESSCIRIKRYLELGIDHPLISQQTLDLTPEELNHLNYLILSIEAFYAQDNKFHTKRSDLIPLIMNHDGPKILKRMKLKSFLTTMGDTLIESPTWWNETPSIYLDDIGEVYNYNYCMFWDSPDEQDYLLSQLPVNVDEKIAKKFTTFVKNFISRRDDFEKVSEEEILLRVSSSVALDKGKSVPHFSVKSAHMDFSKIRSPGKRCFITTGPGQGRDAIINTIEDLNTVQLINENIRMFLEKNFKNHILTGNVENSKKKYFQQCKKSKGFYCRDIKKEGITKPKWITKVILEALHERYPENTAFHYPDFFTGPWFEGDVGQRGHGLGMANEMTTLMQILVFYFTNLQLGKQGYYINATDAYFLNDDAVVFFDEDFEWAFEDFVDVDFETCEALGIMASKEKSFISRKGCVFCEMYYKKDSPNMNNKQSYLLREESIILRAGSITEAKMLLGNLKGDLSQIEEMLLRTYAKLGYEFSENELDWPISFGGARPFKLRGTDFSLNILKNIPDIKVIWKAYQANKCRRLWSRNKFVKNFTHPIIARYPFIIQEEDEFIQSKLGLLSEYDLACMFFRPTKEHKFHSSIKKLYEKRQKIFNTTDKPPTVELFCQDYAQNSLNNVAVLDHQVDILIPVEIFIIKNFKDPYRIKNPVSSYLNSKLKNDPTIPATTWGLFSTDASLLNEKSVFARARTQNTLSLIDRFEEDYESELIVFPKYKDHIKMFMESYPKPFLTSELVEQGNLLRIPQQRFWNPDLTRRIEVYGRYLEFHHLKLAQTRSWQELMWILEFERREPGEYDEEFWEEVFKKYSQSKEITGKISKSSSSSDSDGSGDEAVFRQEIHVVHFSPDFLFQENNEIDKSSKTSSDEELENEIFEDIVSEPIDYGAAAIEKIQEEDRNNPFMKAHGPLPEGDISEYGSIGWIKWLVTEGPIEIEEYTSNDENLEIACADMLTFKTKLITSSNLFDEHNANIRSILQESKKRSWVSHYFDEWINEVPEEDELLEFDVFG